EDVITEVIDAHTSEGHSDDWDFDALWTELKTLYPVAITVDELLTEAANVVDEGGLYVLGTERH
ncbi:MAG: preprotein translocase subunit SecA, partial [Microbacteriaceae bacterium]|nr:preprotein translocase subunit SecA [Microbacteriaceae bacterium]